MEEISQVMFLFQIIDSPNSYLNHNYNSLNLKSIIIKSNKSNRRQSEKLMRNLFKGKTVLVDPTLWKMH